MLTDLIGWYRRNVIKMSESDKQKALNEIKQIQYIIEQSIKLKGVS